jgi:predicted naringenin-chalcone synthase
MTLHTTIRTSESAPVENAPKRVALLGTGTANPASLPQEEIFDIACRIARPTDEQRPWLSRVFRNSGIDHRGIVLAGRDESASAATLADRIELARAFYPSAGSPADRGPTTAVRMARYAEEAPKLADIAASRALGAAEMDASAITHLITASCTGFFAPGLDAALIGSLGLSPAVHRMHIGFMGCHAAFNALSAARDTVRADNAARVLVCCVELCSLHFAYGWDPGRLVANALFADGAGAAVVGSDATGDEETLRLRDSASFLLPGCPDAMTWRIGDHGFSMTLSPGVPKLIREHLGDWCRVWLARHELTAEQIGGWAVHPGGPKILEAVAAAIGLPDEVLLHSRAILSHHGNMSSATVLFILNHMTKSVTRRPIVAIGLGPGLMAEGMLFE